MLASAMEAGACSKLTVLELHSCYCDDFDDASFTRLCGLLGGGCCPLLTCLEIGPINGDLGNAQLGPLTRGPLDWAGGITKLTLTAIDKSASLNESPDQGACPWYSSVVSSRHARGASRTSP